MTGKTLVVLQATGNSIFNNTPSPTQEPLTNGLSQGNFSSTGNVLQLIGLVFLLIIILVAAYYTSKFVGKTTMGQLKNSNFQVIDTYRISPNKVMQIVKVGNKFIVIAISKETITYITELEETEVLVRDFHSKDNVNFKEILDKLKNKMSKNE